jgi:hypothetical protein
MSVRVRLIVVIIVLSVFSAIHVEVPVYHGQDADYYLCVTHC